MEDADEEINSRGSSFAPPTWISFSSFPPQASPSPRRISSNFTPPTRPVRAAKQLAWVCGAEEASSAKSIGGGLNSEEAAAWELFSPIHRVLIVAVIAVAAANSKKNKQIIQLKKSVEIRDQVLLGMQQKLESICKQVDCFKDQPDIPSYNFMISGCGCRLCGNHQLPSVPKKANSSAKAVDDEAMIKCRIPVENDTEPEECRMSDLSDWAPSVSSTVDGQWSTTSIELDLCKELKDKDAIVNELLAFLNTTESNGSKRISELEDIIQHKNMIITKLRKDSLVLEQKVMHLTRLRRASTSKSSLRSRKLPTMTDNLVYDMDSTTSPSSDSDSSTKKHQVSRLKNEDQVLSVKTNNDQSNTSSSRGKQKTRQPNCAELMVKSTKKPPRPISPLKDKPMNQQAHSLNVSRDFKSRSGTTKTRVSSSHIRWV
ncbi:uncharacterized protein LOC112520131 [Cynara cardunculus var. scolymus]|uniref:uncharacterized protein LOC112520131 n=1 Tax=Cynara cardunculus var. scolymus TaxID=59895 RepID=UPI000D6287B3|nr:uncharacterized protein LOC112520131 [Cynara cardunculus var. scolymus]